MNDPPPPAPAGSPLLRNEDWLAVWLGFLIIILVLLGFCPELPKYRWATAGEVAALRESLRPRLGELVPALEKEGEADLARQVEALGAADFSDRAALAGAAERLGASAKLAQAAGRSKGAAALAKRVEDLAKVVGGRAGDLPEAVFGGGNLGRSLILLAATLLLALIGVRLLGGDLRRLLVGFPVVFILAWGSQAIAGSATVSDWGFEYVIFALILGLLISNLPGTPAWLLEAARTEFYIKTGLVILGAGTIFGEILQAGGLGVAQALLVVTAVWYACFWIARRLRVDDEFAVMLSSAVSICGISAAIAACGAIQGDRKKLSYVTSLVLLVAAPMMVVMPWAVRAFNIPDGVAGAWIGGTLDTTGSVVAACGMLGESALKTGVIVKLSQNVLIGLAAFALSIWWAYRGRGAPGKAGEEGKESEDGARPSARVIWERFPKFVLGFLAASLVFSFLIDPARVKATKDALAGLRGTWFALAFVSIGLETRLGDLFKMGEGRPALAFILAQAFNVVWTLGISYLLFRGV